MLRNVMSLQLGASSQGGHTVGAKDRKIKRPKVGA